jgi:aspartyl/asparaginyl beta-hydroxylase (cupin superfamily)
VRSIREWGLEIRILEASEGLFDCHWSQRALLCSSNGVQSAQHQLTTTMHKICKSDFSRNAVFVLKPAPGHVD